MRKFCSIVLLFFGTQCFAAWEECKPLRTKNPNLYGARQDVESQLPDGHPYGHQDASTHTHEAVHGINSRLRAKHPGSGCFYTLNGNYMRLREPNVTLRMVANEVQHRGPVFDLYLLNAQQWWNDQPSYILDELSAYIAGTIAAIQYKQPQHEIDYSKARAFEMLGYARVLVEVVKQRDPNYRELNDLIGYLDYCKLRLETL